MLQIKELIISHNNKSVRIIVFLKDATPESSILTTAFKQNRSRKVKQTENKITGII